MSSRPEKTARFGEIPQRWQPVGNTASDLTSPVNELKISGSRIEHGKREAR